MHMNRTFKHREWNSFLSWFIEWELTLTNPEPQSVIWPFPHMCVLNIKSIVKSNQERSSQDYASNLSKQQGELCN